jgi:hypothetical protein
MQCCFNTMAITRICSDQNHLVKGTIQPAATNPLVVHEGLPDSSYIYSHSAWHLGQQKGWFMDPNSYKWCAITYGKPMTPIVYTSEYCLPSYMLYSSDQGNEWISRDTTRHSRSIAVRPGCRFLIEDMVSSMLGCASVVCPSQTLIGSSDGSEG